MSHGLRRIILAAMAAGVSTLCAQTTDGFVTGTLRDSVSGNPIPGASIVCESAATNTRVPARSGEDGSFGLPLMPPGNYRVRVEEATHQAVDIQNLVLPVAGVLNLDLRLRPLSDVWERNQYRSVYLPGSRTMAVFSPLVSSRLASSATRSTSCSETLMLSLLCGFGKINRP